MDLFGWDTVFVGGIDKVNQALAGAGDVLIQTFTFTEDGVSASGTFGAWSIVPGGSGELLHLCFPIASGQFTLAPGVPATDLAGSKVVLQVPLRWLEGQDAKDTRELAFDLREVAREGSRDPAKVSVVSVSPTNRLTPNQARNVGHAIAAYISAHAAQVSFVLAAVDPAAVGTPPWLHPSASAFTVVSPADGSAPALAIMSVVAVRDTSSLPRNIDAGLLPGAGGNAAFGIAGPLVLRDIIGPAITSGLRLSPDRIGPGPNGGIALAGPIDLPPLPSGKIPMLSLVTAVLKDARVTIAYAGGMDLAPGIRMTFNVTCELESAIVPPSVREEVGSDIPKRWREEERLRHELSGDDRPLREHEGAITPSARLSFHVVSVDRRHEVQMEWWIKLMIAFTPFPALTDQFLEKVTEEVASALVNLISNALAGWAPGAIELAPVLWSGGSKFSPSSAQLAGTLVLRGTLN